MADNSQVCSKFFFHFVNAVCCRRKLDEEVWHCKRYEFQSARSEILYDAEVKMSL